MTGIMLMKIRQERQEYPIETKNKLTFLYLLHFVINWEFFLVNWLFAKKEKLFTYFYFYYLISVWSDDLLLNYQSRSSIIRTWILQLQCSLNSYLTSIKIRNYHRLKFAINVEWKYLRFANWLVSWPYCTKSWGTNLKWNNSNSFDPTKRQTELHLRCWKLILLNCQVIVSQSEFFKASTFVLLLVNYNWLIRSR